LKDSKKHFTDSKDKRVGSDSTFPNPPDRHFNYCPRCKSEQLSIYNKKILKCLDCDFEYYFNPAAAVAAIITDKEGNLLITIRAFEPCRGSFDLPGGFVDPGESCEEAIRREIKEELNLEVISLNYFCSMPNVYEYKQIKYTTVDIAYLCEVENAALAKASDDVKSILFLNPKELDINKFGLQSIRTIVSQYLSKFSH
jgi:ADP-ribose pyrophosphatase YjhB (NUDIX family)